MASATRVFKTRPFDRWARDEGITDKMLLDAVRELEAGLNDGKLGKFLFKKRIAMPRASKGKSGGARTIVAMRSGDRVVFMHGYLKSEKNDITIDEKLKYRERAKELMSYNASEIETHIYNSILIEVKNVSANSI